MRTLLAAAAGLLLLASVACSTTADAQDEASPRAAAQTASERAWATQADDLGSLLFSLTTASLSFTFEPKGDITKAAVRRQGAPILVSVRLCTVDSRSRRVTFNAVQTFIGASARKQARADGQPVQGNIYHRDRFHHRQTMSLADHCPIVTRAGVGREPTNSGTQAVTVKELQASGGAVPGWYWLLVGSDSVVGMLQQYYN